MANDNVSHLGAAQIANLSFDGVEQAIRTIPASATTMAIEISAADGDTVMAVGTTDGTISGTQKALKVDSSGELQVDVLTLPTVTLIANSFLNLAANATTTVKSGAGTLNSITVNTKGLAANTVTVYDNTAGSGTKIATIDSTAQLITLDFNVSFATGLTVVIATGTAADITVSYR